MPAPVGPQRILLVSGSLPPMKCGVGDYTWRLAAALAATGADVSIVTSRAAAPAPTPSGVRLYPVMERWSIGELGRILAVIRRTDPQIVHVQYPTQGYGRGNLPTLLPLLARLVGRRVVQTWHEYHTGTGLKAAIGFLTKGIGRGAFIVVRPGYRQAIAPRWRRLLRDRAFHFIPNASAIPAVRLSSVQRLQIHQEYAVPGARLIAFFGFIFPAKRVELLFEIADPACDCLVIVGEFRGTPEYRRMVEDLAAEARWRGRVRFTGFLEEAQAARLMAAADAVVLPFAEGGGEWNTSISAAQAQGTFVLTTSANGRRYDVQTHTHYADPADVEDMRRALSHHIGERGRRMEAEPVDLWNGIAQQHLSVYTELASGGRGAREIS